MADWKTGGHNGDRGTECHEQHCALALAYFSGDARAVLCPVQPASLSEGGISGGAGVTRVPWAPGVHTQYTSPSSPLS